MMPESDCNRQVIPQGCGIHYVRFRMMCSRIFVFIAFFACCRACLAISPPLAIPMDLERHAADMDAFCSIKAPDLKPPFLERFRAWKERLGPYYPRYQQWLYDGSVKQFPVAERAVRLKALKDIVDAEVTRRFRELETQNYEAHEMCHLMGKSLTDPKFDDQLRRLLDEESLNQ